MFSKLIAVGFAAALLVSPNFTAVAAAQSYDLTMDVLVNSQNTAGYNSSSTSPGEYQRYVERYLEHLQVPYRVIDTATQEPPTNLGSEQLIVAAHKGLNLSVAWQQAILQAVQGGTGFVNFDSDTSIGTDLHIQGIFGATGSTAGTAATQIAIPASVMPDGSGPQYITSMQIRLPNTPAGDKVYQFHQDVNDVLQTATATVLQGASGTVLAYLGGDPLVLATQTSGGRAVNFGTYDFMRPDRFGFVMGVDDIIWRSLVWAARKPFIVRGYPRFYASQMDDEVSGWGQRLADLWNTNLTGTVKPDGTGGPWKITAMAQLVNLQPGAQDRTDAISAVNSGNLKIAFHTNTGISQGDLYWNPNSSSPLTDDQWSTNLANAMAIKQGNGGADTLPPLSKSMVPHFWNLSDNTGYDLWHSLGTRYITEIQKPGAYYAEDPKPDSMRLMLHPFRVYELPPTYGNPNEKWPIYYADDIVVGSRNGLPPQTFFAFCTQLLGYTYPSFDARWPNDNQGVSVAESVENFEDYAWRFWSSMAPVQMYNHDGGSFERSTESQRQQAITQISAFLNANNVRHVFMEDLGAYMRARTKSLLSTASASPTTLTLNFTGSALDADGNPIATYLYVYYGDDEGVMLQVPGFSNGTTWTTPNSAPSRIGLSSSQLVFDAIPGGQTSSQFVTVSNTGSGSLAFTAQSDSPWLSVNPTSGAAPQSLAITADPTGLSSGSYAGKIAVQSLGAINTPQQISVAFNVAPNATQPTLSVSASSLSFAGYVGSGSPAAQQVSISNQSGGTIDWTAASNAPWLQVSAASGTAPSSLNISVNTAGLSAGTYTGAITISAAGANGSPQTIAVSLTMTGLLLQSTFSDGTLAGWAYSPLGLAANWSVANSTVSYNGGGHTQIYAGNGNWQDYTIQADFLLTSLSDYPGGIRGRVNPASGAAYAAWIYPAEGVIKLWRASAWNIDSSPVQLGVSARLVMDSINWHTIAMKMNGNQITVVYDGSPVITVTDTALTSGMVALDVSNKPISFRNVVVSSNQGTSSQLNTSPASLTFTANTGAASASQNLQIATSDSSVTAWTVTGNVPWISASPTNGKSPATVSLVADATTLAPGGYSGALVVSSLGTSNTSVSVPVSFTVTQNTNLQIAASPTTLSFDVVSGAVSNIQTVSIQSSSGSLTYSASSDSPWLVVSPATGTTTSNIQVSANAATLPPGSYSGNISVTSASAQNSPLLIPVSLQVSQVSNNTLAIAPGILSFVGSTTTNAPTQIVGITSSSGSPIAWSSSWGGSWFALGPNSGTTPGTMQAAISNIGFAAGTYNDTLTITPTNAGIASITAPISLRIGNLLFSDNFSSGTADNWTASPMGLASGWSVVNGAYQYNGGGATQQYAGSSSWTNYTLQADVNIVAASNYPGGIRVRVNPLTGSGYALWLYPGTGTVKLFRVTQWNIDGSGTVALSTKTGIPFLAGTHHLRIDVQGSTISAFLDNVQVLSATDATYTTGAVALDVSNKVVAFSNISVVSY